MQLELLYDIIVVSIETDELDTIIHYCAELFSYSSLCKKLVMFPHLLSCVIIIMNIFIVFHTWCHHCPYKV